MDQALTPWPLVPGTRPLRIDLIGARGYNAVQRVLPELAPYAEAIDLVGYDLADGPAEVHGCHIVQVRDNADLASRVHERCPDVVWIETPDDTHAEHIRLALEAGARQVLCEKCIALDAAGGAEVLQLCRQAEPGQHVGFIDHYLLLSLVRTLYANTGAWLGRVRQVQVTLLESQGVPPHQERSHANGMTNFFHHVVALTGLWFDLNELVPVEAAWARHPEARVPDTFRAARFGSIRTGGVVLEGVVGKYMGQATKQIYVYGTQGQARIDRDHNRLDVRCADDRSFSLPGANGDTGYGELARALATGTPLPALLTPTHALQVLLLVEQAQARARSLAVHADGDRQGESFVCDWELTRLGPDTVQRPWPKAAR
jgi:predicted dehydrogenase